MNDKSSLSFQGNTIALLNILLKNGKISISKWKNVLRYLVRSFILTPSYLAELVFRSRKINRTTIEPSPIFIIGHYRSGTTYLHKLLSCDRRWGKIKTFNFIFPFWSNWSTRKLQPAIQAIFNRINYKNPHFNNYLLDLNDPIEEDMVTIASFSPYSAFWGEVFPKNFRKIFNKHILLDNANDLRKWQKTYLYLLKKTSLKNNGKRLMLKNPPNTGRVKAILELFPDAKFVFIYRNPYQVYYSTYRLWKELLEKTYALQTISDEERQENIFYHYKKIMQSYLDEKHLIPAENIVEVRYEDMEEDPFLTVKTVYEQLNLGDFEQAEVELNKLLSKEKKYSKYKYIYDDETQNEIYAEWGAFIDQWNYERLSNTEHLMK